MRILSFDTTNSCVSVALLNDGERLCERLFRATGTERQESVTLLLPAIKEMLGELEWKKSELELIVVGVGPGSFTGIRIAVVTARTLAQALDLPLLGVSLLDCYAASLQTDSAVILSAGRGHFYFAAFSDVASGRPVESVVAQHGTIDVLKEVLGHVETWAVEPSLVEVLAEQHKDVVVLPEISNIAIKQGELAWQKVSMITDEIRDRYRYQSVEPLYLRGASVTLKGKDGKAATTT